MRVSMVRDNADIDIKNPKSVHQNVLDFTEAMFLIWKRQFTFSSKEGGRIEFRWKNRILVPMGIGALFVFSGVAFSGLVAAGGHQHNPQGPQGFCWFQQDSYSIGDTMTIEMQGSGGNPDKGFFKLDLTNPSGVIVGFTDLYRVESFSATASYVADRPGIWRAELTYNVPGKKNTQTTLLASYDANVPGGVDRLTLEQRSYDPASGSWQGLATLLDPSGTPLAGETVVLQGSTDGGATWRNTRHGSYVTDEAGQAVMTTSGPSGFMLRVTYSADNLVSNIVTM